VASSVASSVSSSAANSVIESAQRITPAEYERLRVYVYDEFGLALGPGREQMVVARLGPKLRERSFTEYFEAVRRDATGQELVALIDALTTNHTSFFREQSHFEYLSREVLPTLPVSGYGSQKGSDAGDEIWFWSAASSTGEEPYSLAMWLLEHGGGRRFRILATDISTRVLELARRGVYPEAKLDSIPAAWRSKYLLRGEGRSEGYFRMRPEVRAMVQYERLNLVRPPLQVAHRFPVIFCRNVMIYFDPATQERLLCELAKHLWPGGYLYTGHSESLNRLNQPLEYVRPAVYRKPGARES
jgi:chemotaxis protein methyltransferase CheR